MPELNEITQTHLSVFALEKIKGTPLQRMLFYAEVGIVQELLPYTVSDESLQIDSVLIVVNAGDQEFATRLRRALRQAIATFIAEAYFNSLSFVDRDALLRKILNTARELLGNTPI